MKEEFWVFSFQYILEPHWAYITEKWILSNTPMIVSILYSSKISLNFWIKSSLTG
jgi:hypothetical protein